MDPARRRSVVDVALEEGAMVSVEAGIARQSARSVSASAMSPSAN